MVLCVSVCESVWTCAHTYALDGVGAGGPDEHRDSGVLLIGVELEADLVGGHAEGGDHLTDAAGERVPEGGSDITTDIIQVPLFQTSLILNLILLVLKSKSLVSDHFLSISTLIRINTDCC